MVSVLHDISEVERVEKTRRDFIANVSHELRTPLTSIRGYAETMLESDGLLNDNAREFLQVIRRNAERMGRLTEDLLVLARVESGEEKLDLRPQSARQLLAEALSPCRKTPAPPRWSSPWRIFLTGPLMAEVTRCIRSSAT